MPNFAGRHLKPMDDTLYTLQVGRGFAALAVLFHHTANGVERRGGDLPDWLSTLCSYGYLGVDFFFVLSGFIIYYVNHPRRDRPRFVRSYIESRLIRVFVPYLPIGIAVAVAYLVVPQLASGDNSWNWFSTLTLLPSSAHPALAPAWTLQHELLFYFVALVALRMRSVLPIAISSAGVILAIHLFYPMDYKSLGLVDLEFLFGVAAAWSFLNKRTANNWLLVSAGLAFCVAFFLIDNRLYSVIFGLGLALLLLPVIEAEKAGKFRMAGSLLLLGDASYALYLIHYPLISALSRLAGRLDPVPAFIGIMVACVVAGIVYHMLFERRALVWVKRLTASVSGTQPASQKAATGSSAEDPSSPQLTNR